MSRTQVVAMEPGSRMPPAAARTLPPAPSCAKPARGRPPRHDQIVRNNILLQLTRNTNNIYAVVSLFWANKLLYYLFDEYLCKITLICTVLKNILFELKFFYCI